MGSSRVIVVDATDLQEINFPLVQAGPGTLEIVAASLNKKHRVKGMMFTMTADGTAKFRSGGVDLTGPMNISAMGGMVEVDLASLIQGTKNNNIDIVTTGGGANGVIKIVTEDA